MELQLFYDSITLFISQGLSFLVGALMVMAFALGAR